MIYESIAATGSKHLNFTKQYITYIIEPVKITSDLKIYRCSTDTPDIRQMPEGCDNGLAAGSTGIAAAYRLSVKIRTFKISEQSIYYTVISSIVSGTS